MILLANISNLHNKTLHDRDIKNRFMTDEKFANVTSKRARRRDPGSRRVVAETDPRIFLDDPSYPESLARIEIGFHGRLTSAFQYWINWIEPERSLMIGWHQDDDHPCLGPVHIQLNWGEQAIDHKQAKHIDEHPMAIVEARLQQIPAAIDAVQWESGDAVGLNW
jgi:hypothetical protein